MRDRVSPAGALAHKLKQPLAVAWGYLELILDDSSTLDPTVLRYLREIQLAVQSMDDMVNRLQVQQHPGGLDRLDLEDLSSVA
jgi:signal transduction histidine kinase